MTLIYHPWRGRSGESSFSGGGTTIMKLIYHPRMSHQANDPEYKVCCHYAEMLINILNHPIKNKALGVMTLIYHPRMSHPFQGEGDPPRTLGGGDVTVCNMQQGEGEPRGGGAVMSHPYQEGVGAEMSHPKRGGGQGRMGLHQSQPRGGGGGQIMLMCRQSVCLTTYNASRPTVISTVLIFSN